MPFETPSLKENIERAQAEINSRLKGGESRLWASVLRVLAFVIGGAVTGLYGYLRQMAWQLMIDSATGRWLERWASIWGIFRKKASFAVGQVLMPGVVGAVVPVGTLVQRPDGVQYKTTAEVSFLAAGSLPVPVVAVEAGVKGNLAAGTEMILVSPVIGITSPLTVDDAGIAGAADEEKDEPLRARLLKRIRNPPHGGIKEDYEMWALEVPGVTRAWCYPMALGAGTVTVRFVCDDDPDSIFPSEQKVKEVKDHIEAVRPVTAELFVVSPIPYPINFVITDVKPSSQDVKTAIVFELSDLLLRSAVPGGKIPDSHIRASISAAKGEYDHKLVAPLDGIVSEEGYMARMGGVSWL